MLSIYFDICGRAPRTTLHLSSSAMQVHFASSFSRVMWIVALKSTNDDGRVAQCVRYSMKGSISSTRLLIGDYNIICNAAVAELDLPTFLTDQVKYTLRTRDLSLSCLSIQSFIMASAGVMPIPTAKSATTL